MKISKLYIPFVCASLLFGSCDSLLDTESKTLLSQEQIQTEKGCEAMLIGAYDLLQSAYLYGRDLINIPEVLADNSTLSPTATRYKGQADNRIGSHVDIWVDSYQIIALLNEVISYAEELPETSKAKAVLGEALALRGFTYFNLARVYGREPGHLVDNFQLCVPLLLKPFYYNGGQLGEDVYPARATVTETWAQIENDMTRGFELMKGNETNSTHRMSALSCMALLSRVYLYEGKWQECIDAANYVTANAKQKVFDGTDYKELFKTQSESLFYVFFTESEGLGSSSLQSTNGMLPSEIDEEGYDLAKGVGDGDLVMSDELVSLYQPEDIRFQSLRKAKINGIKAWWTTKYGGYLGVFGLDNVPVIRISEVVLNRAEAEAELNHTDAALADVNEIRTKRGLTETTATGTDLLNEVLLQRRLELCQEGHRFFDLKRRGQNITKPAGRTEVAYEDFRVVGRISDTQMDANKNLVNNPGY